MKGVKGDVQACKDVHQRIQEHERSNVHRESESLFPQKQQITCPQPFIQEVKSSARPGQKAEAGQGEVLLMLWEMLLNMGIATEGTIKKMGSKRTGVRRNYDFQSNNK